MYSRKRIEKFAKYGDAKEKFEKKVAQTYCAYFAKLNTYCFGQIEVKSVAFWLTYTT